MCAPFWLAWKPAPAEKWNIKTKRRGRQAKDEDRIHIVPFGGLPSRPSTLKTEGPHSLLNVKRVFVDRFGGGETASQIRDMVIASLQESGLFVLTENPERADVTLKGSGEDLVFTDQHSTSDSLDIHANAGAGSSTRGYTSRNSSDGIGVGEHESSHQVERKHEASVSVRLVNHDGDILWSTTKESQGGKFRGASADVADKILKQLVQDVEKARASSAKQAATPAR